MLLQGPLCVSPRVGGGCGQQQCHHSADGTWALPAAVTTAWVTRVGQGGREGAHQGTHPRSASKNQALSS